MNTAATEVRLYWRPGCGFCVNLRRQLEREGVEHQTINIWEDPHAAATVRSVAGGSETVPTVVIGSRALVNPSLRTVLQAIHAETPDEERAATEPAAPPGRFASIFGKPPGDNRQPGQ